MRESPGMSANGHESLRSVIAEAASRPMEAIPDTRHPRGCGQRLGPRYAGVQFAPLAMVSGITTGIASNDFFRALKSARSERSLLTGGPPQGNATWRSAARPVRSTDA